MNLWNAKFAQVVFNNLLTRFQSPVIFTQRLKLLLLFRTKAIFVKKKTNKKTDSSFRFSIMPLVLKRF